MWKGSSAARMLDQCNDVLVNYLAHVYWYLVDDTIDKHYFVHRDGAIMASRHDHLLNKNQPKVGFSIQVVREELILFVGIMFYFVPGQVLFSTHLLSLVLLGS